MFSYVKRLILILDDHLKESALPTHQFRHFELAPSRLFQYLHSLSNLDIVCAILFYHIYIKSTKYFFFNFNMVFINIYFFTDTDIFLFCLKILFNKYFTNLRQNKATK